MSNLGRSIIQFALVSASMVYGSLSTAQPQRGKSQVSGGATRASRTAVEGKFGHYLESPTGHMDGIVLEDGTVARFPLFGLAPEATPFRPGDAVRVEGDGLSSLTGPVLLNASVEKGSDRFVRANMTPAPSATGPRPSSRFHRGPQRIVLKGKTKGQSGDPRGGANGSLSVAATKGRAGKKARGETFWLPGSGPRAVAGDAGDASRWSRSRETSAQ